MDALPDKPAGSVIEESTDRAGVTLSWPVSSPGPSRFEASGVLVLWLCLWAMGWTAAARQLTAGGAPPSLVFWLGVLTVGGGLAVWTLWLVVRPARPESVRLEADVLRYDPGRAPYDPWRPDGLWGHPAPPERPHAFQVDRPAVGGVVLERVGGRERLCLNRGADRREIGAGLRDPEREWLFAVLRRWHSPKHLPQ
jgi:hypothetical protein